MAIVSGTGVKGDGHERLNHEPNAPSPSLTQDALILGLFIALGFVLRWQLMARMQFSIDSDEAIVGLMANHILEGRGIPVFYYGQHYMGSLEAILVASAFWLFGSSSLVLRSVPLVVSLSMIPVMYLLGREAAGRRSGLIAACLFAIPPAALVEWSTKPRGGFIEIVWLSAVCLWCALKWTRTGVPSLRQSSVIGFLLGVGWWVNNQIIFTIATVGVIWALTIGFRSQSFSRGIRHGFTHGLAGVATFLIGGAPFWIHNILSDFQSFKLFGPSSEPWTNAVGFFENGLPIIVGAKRFWSTTEVWSGSAIFAAVLYGIVALILCVMRGPIGGDATSEDLKDCGSEHPFAVLLPAIFIIATATIFSLSSFGWLSSAPRYLLPLYPPLFVLIAVALSRVRGVLAVAGVGIFVAFHVASSAGGGWPVPGEPFVYKEERVARDHRSLIKWLTEHQVAWVRTNYWIGYRLAFETGERVRFLVLGKPRETRIAEYPRAAEAVPVDAFVYVLTPRLAQEVAESMVNLGMTFERTEVGSYVILHDVHHPLSGLERIDSARISATASVNPDSAGKAIDGSLETRWGSAQPQSSGMMVRVAALDGAIISGVRISLGAWWTDHPRELLVECEVGSDKRTVLSPSNFRSLDHHLGWEDLELSMKGLPCNAVVLRQLGAHPLFDWSIAEVQLFQQRSYRDESAEFHP